MKVCNNYSLIHKFLINHILLQTVLLIGVCGLCLLQHQKKKYYVAVTAFFSLSPPTMVVPPKKKTSLRKARVSSARW
jgi:hypothetical protein